MLRKLGGWPVLRFLPPVRLLCQCGKDPYTRSRRSSWPAGRRGI